VVIGMIPKPADLFLSPADPAFPSRGSVSSRLSARESAMPSRMVAVADGPARAEG
jgi:hypothetical protein